MANSLKSMFSALGPILGETPDALYAYQRAFVRGGLLESTPGRGPGSGVKAGPMALAEFLIGMLTNASNMENVKVAEAIARAVPGGICPLTGAKRFKDALARVLSDEALATRVNDIRVSVNGGYAQILYDGSSSEMTLGSSGKKAKVVRQPENSVFMAKVAKGGGLHFEASILSDTLLSLIKEMPK